MIGIALYAAIMVMVYGFLNPALHKMIGLMKSGEMGPEFGTHAKKVKTLGPIVEVFFFVIIILMASKPGE